MCCSVNVYVDGCCVQRLSVGEGEGSIAQLKAELSRSLDPLVLQAKLEDEEGCVVLDTVDHAETDGAPATFLALLCSFGSCTSGTAKFILLSMSSSHPAPSPGCLREGALDHLPLVRAIFFKLSTLRVFLVEPPI